MFGNGNVDVWVSLVNVFLSKSIEVENIIMQIGHEIESNSNEEFRIHVCWVLTILAK